MDKEGHNYTSLEILFKGTYQSIFSKKDDTAKITKSESKWKVLNFTLDKCKSDCTSHCGAIEIVPRPGKNVMTETQC